MSNARWPGIATATAILWIISNTVWLGVAGPIWHASSKAGADAWIGFAGNALGASVTLLAAIAAGIAAYRTIVPMQSQLAELVRQNNFAHYERLRVRAADLWDQRLLIERTNANLEVMEHGLSLTGLGANEGRKAAFERLEDSAEQLNASRRLVWGDQNAQSLTKFYADHVMVAGNHARRSLLGTHQPFEEPAWKEAKATAWRAGVALWSRINLEITMLSHEIASLEPTILNRASFPQLWNGDYPGPDKLAEIYAARSAPAEPNGPKAQAINNPQ